ncbi:elongation factor G [Nocardia macrotermitis]|uniref:Tetracycline resistance protein TetM n=1 Tax=Nocardia macrotermitis TaxID=2585198 RepID=A0A7K0D9S1_9NOCA|nr:TetM/TetW/TetO/TetS family tetracycline resistance ribosomal protection protein [Nocardia macrotermitis]MQY22520.1 Tetracycline resistance protein TetM [Nocardia macrotermitis]
MHTHHTIAIGVLAHVDAGKTSLTERLLFDTGTIHTLGRVDDGTTATDTGDIERRRGITVRSAVVSFAHNNTRVDVIDTPGHTDFVAEVERALEVLDAAILVISAVEGVQPHTRMLMRILRAAGVPTLLFVNKIDRAGARTHELLEEIRLRLTPHPIPMNTVREPGDSTASATPNLLSDNAFRSRVIETLADVDDLVLARAVDGPALRPNEIRDLLAARTADATVHPLYFGSARTGQGIGALLDGITELLPAFDTDHAGGVPRGIVFALERSASGMRIAYLRLLAGALAVRRQIGFEHSGTGHSHSGTITSLRLVGGGERTRLHAGEIGTITGFPLIRVGDRIEGTDHPKAQRHKGFAEPILRTSVRARNTSPSRLYAALLVMGEHDPLLRIHREPDGTTSILLYGEVQKQIIAETLSTEFGIEAEFLISEPICIERVTGVGESIEQMGYRTTNPAGFWATLGLRVAPADIDSGVAIERETRYGSLPHAFHHAIDDSIRTRLRNGPAGRSITDCVVTVTHTGFAAPLTTAADFRELTPIVLDRALQAAGTRILEPTHLFEMTVPTDTLSPVSTYLSTLAAEIRETTEDPGGWLIRGVLPARYVHTVQLELPRLTRGEGSWWSEHTGYRPRDLEHHRRNRTHTRRTERGIEGGPVSDNQ